MHHVENKNLPTPLLNFFDNVKNDLNLKTTTRTRKKLKVPLFKSSKTQKTAKYQGVTVKFTINKFLKIIFSKIFL